MFESSLRISSFGFPFSLSVLFFLYIYTQSTSGPLNKFKVKKYTSTPCNIDINDVASAAKKIIILILDDI